MSKIKTNIIYNLGYQVCVLIVPLVTTPYLSRVLNVKGVGTYSYVSSVAYYFFIFVTLGLTNYGNRSIAKCGDDREQRSRTFWSIYTTQIFCGVIVIIAYLMYTFYRADREYKRFFLIYSLYIFSAIIDINWLYFGLEEFRFTTVRNIIVKLATLMCVFMFVRGTYALSAYFIIVAGSSFAGNLLLWTRIPRYLDFYKPTWKECVKHVKPNLLLFLPIIAMSVYRVMDKIMIKELSGVLQNGYYESADKIITVSLTAFSAVSTVMMPAVSGMVAKNDHSAVKKLLRDTMRIVNWLAIAMVFGLMVVSKRFAPLFFGRDFAEAGILMVGLAPTIFLSGWKSVLRSQYLIPYEKDWAYVLSLITGACCNIILNLVFIPQYGARGAVIGTLSAEISGFLIQTYVASKAMQMSGIVKDFVCFIPSGIIMSAFASSLLKLLPNSLISIVIVVFVDAVVYITASLLTMYILDKEKFHHFMRNIKVNKVGWK